MDAPALGETAPDQIKQQDLWFSKPAPEDTAITLVSRPVREVVSQNFESYAYDKGVLDGLLSFDTFFRTYGEKLIVKASGRPAEDFSLSLVELEKFLSNGQVILGTIDREILNVEIWGKWPGDESIEDLLSALTP